MKRRDFAEGEMIFSEGDDSREAYLILSGRVEVLKASPAGPLCLAILGTGDLLGEMGLLEDQPRSATARALEPVATSAIEGEEFLHLILHKPEDGLALLRALFERLRSMNQRLAELNRGVEGAREIPRVMLYPLTPETEQAVAPAGLAVTRFPFRVGRRPASREEEALGFNDVELPDAGARLVSLNHFAIDLGGPGDGPGVVIRDRGSRQGTEVNGARIGSREARDHAPLVAGDNEVAIGAAASPLGGPASRYRFRIALAAN
jgi:CRP-like cAMP-binding protein